MRRRCTSSQRASRCFTGSAGPTRAGAAPARPEAWPRIAASDRIGAPDGRCVWRDAALTVGPGMPENPARCSRSMSNLGIRISRGIVLPPYLGAGPFRSPRYRPRNFPEKGRSSPHGAGPRRAQQHPRRVSPELIAEALAVARTAPFAVDGYLPCAFAAGAKAALSGRAELTVLQSWRGRRCAEPGGAAPLRNGIPGLTPDQRRTR
jgi:hypothetical protein